MITHHALCPTGLNRAIASIIEAPASIQNNLEITTPILETWAKRCALLGEMKGRGESPEEFAAFLKESRPDDYQGASTFRRWRKMKSYDDKHGTRTMGGQLRLGRKPEISDLVLLLCLPGWFKRRTKSSKVHHREVAKWCKERQIKMPSYSTYRRWAPLFDQDFLEKNIMDHLDWYAKNAPTIFQPDGDSNDVWIADACELKIWVTDGKRVFRPNIVVIIDKASRMVMGWMISQFPINSDDTIGCLKMAIMPKRLRGTSWSGKPKVLQLDRGGPFKSAQFLANLARLGITPDYCLPRCPQQKGRIERFFATLGEQFVKNFEDKIARCETPEDEEETKYVQAYWGRVVRRLDEQMLDYCLDQVHSGHGQTPYEAWEDRITDNSTINLDYVELGNQLYVERVLTATKCGVQVLQGQFFINENFNSLRFGEDKVTVQLPPDGVDKGPVRGFFGNTPLGVLKRNGEDAKVAAVVKAVYKTHQADRRELRQELKGSFERLEKYLGDLVGGEPEPKRSVKKAASKPKSSRPPTGVVVTSVTVGEVK
jgi:transposase InsO family protein